jgi:O-antigen ligase
MFFNTSISKSTLPTREFLFIKLFQLCVFSIPISSFVSVRLLFLTLIFSFFLGKSFGDIWNQALDMFIYLFILAIGLVYSEDVTAGFKVLETSFSLLAIPLIFYRLHPIDTKIRDKIFHSFLIGVVVSSLLCLVFASYRYSITPNLQFFFFETFTEVIKSHPTYLAYYIIFSITVELYDLYYRKDQQKLWLHYLIILFLFIVLMLTGGQTAFISMLFVFSFFILKFLTDEKDIQRSSVVGSIILMLVCMFLVSIAERDYKYLELNDSWERATLWKSAVSANSNILLGVGTGDYKIALNQYYTAHNLALFAKESYNAHNQFLQLLFSNGLLGLASLLVMLGRPLYLGIKSNNVLAILCIFPFMIYGITEVFLGRYQGVVFFALIHQIFMVEMNSQNILAVIQKNWNELDVKPF